MNNNQLVLGEIDNSINDSITGYITTTDYHSRMLKISIDEKPFLLTTILDTSSEKNKQLFKFYVPKKYEDGKLHNVELIDLSTNLVLDSKQFIFHYLEINPEECKKLKQYESEYKKNRPIKQRLRSLFYPISILLNKNKFGSLKHTIAAIRAYSIIKKDNLLDMGYYLNNNPILQKEGDDVILHYFYEGFHQGLKPHRNFDGNRYLLLNHDVKEANFNPLVHYALYGRSEKRNIKFDSDFSSLPESLQHDIETINDSGLFNETFYLEKYNDVSNSKIHPIEHYVRFGYKERRNPSSTFNTDYYIKTYDDCNVYSTNPLIHYINVGMKDNRTTTGVNGHINIGDDKESVEGWFIQRDDNEFEGKLIIDRNEYKLQEILFKDEDSENDEEYYRFTYKVPEFFLDGRTHFIKFVDSNGMIIDSIVQAFHDINNPDEKHKRILSDEDKEYLAGVIEDVDLSSVPVFGDDAPLVSIVVVNRDGLGHLERLFGAMGAVSDFYPNFEVVVVDNASCDGSVDFVRGWDGFRVVVVENDVNESFSRANNQALDVASGDYLLFLNNDVEPISGFLNFMMESLLGGDGVGAVGARLFYPDCSGSRLNREKSFSLQHDGIVFRESEGFVRPFNRGNGCEVVDCDGGVVRRVAGVTGACLLVERGVFERFGGFDEAFVYGYEDVDFCLKLVRAGLDVLCDGRARLYHYEFGTQELDVGREVRDRRLSNRRVFVGRWNSWLRRELLLDKLSGDCVFGDGALCVAFVVTECGDGAVAGDYFTALGLAGVFESFGWDVRFLSQDSGRWYFVDDDVDVLVSLLDRYDLSRVVCGNGLLVKVAWLRNWFERWVGRPYFMMYDLVLCSSSLACDYVTGCTGKESVLFPIATDTGMFNEDVPSSNDFVCDYCFTGSYWNAKREIIDYLNPDDLEYKFNLYGANWEKIEKLSPYHKGFVNYNQVPELYSSTKIVIDDANHVTKQWASVNSRVFDALAMGRLVLTNGSCGNDEIFDGQIPEYHSQEELKQQLSYYMENPDERQKKIESLKTIVLENHTYEIRAKTFKQLLLEFIDKYKIAIKIPAPRWSEVHMWGDFYLAEGLLKEFTKRGYFIKLQILPEWDDSSDSMCDAVIVLRGLSQYTPKLQHYNIMWNISHPNNVKIKEYELYDHVFIASQKWADTVSSRVSVPVECMWQCTDTDRFYPDYSPQYHHELLFVGNSRKVHRKILKDLLPTEHELAVYGADWDDLIDDKYIIDEFIDNKQLRKAYSSCDLLLNDHWEDMRIKGFISNRIFDAIACGATIISDDIQGLEELFPKRVYMYDSEDSLKELIDEILDNPKQYDISIIKKHTFKQRVNKILNVWN